MTLDWKKSGDWVVVRRRVSRRALAVLFVSDEPTISELVSLRRIAPELGATPAADIRRRVGTTGRFDLGEFGGIEARRIMDAANREGLTLHEEMLDRTELLPFNRESSAAWLIEDQDENRRVCLAMIDDGCPVQEQEID
jgi:hypothetical protein